MSETEPETTNPGIPGQILYPEVEVDAERAGAFVAGKEDTLYPETEADEGDSEDAGE